MALTKKRRESLGEVLGGMADAFAELREVARLTRVQLRRLETYARGGRALLGPPRDEA